MIFPLFIQNGRVGKCILRLKDKTKPNKETNKKEKEKRRTPNSSCLWAEHISAINGMGVRVGVGAAHSVKKQGRGKEMRPTASEGSGCKGGVGGWGGVVPE